MKLSVMNVRDMLIDSHEDIVRSYIEMFSCVRHRDEGTAGSLNPDIEHFLHHNAIQFARMKTAVTYLVIDQEDGAFLGYFTLAHKPLSVSADGLSRKVRDQLRDVQNQIGGTLIYLDCEANAGLIRFYEGQNFTLFGERISENDGKRYLQYLNFV